MLYEKMKEVIKFVDSIDTAKLHKLVTDAGFEVKPNDMQFIEIVKMYCQRAGCTVFVLYLDNDKWSECYGEEHQIHFDIDDKLKVTNLDFVQAN